MRHARFSAVCALVVLIGISCDATSGQPPPAPPDRLQEFRQASPNRIAQYLIDHPIRKVQLGAGSSRLKGWLNTDIEPGDGLAYLDATQRFPFEDGSIHYIFSEHVIEHLSYEEGKLMVAESLRVLVPGGRMRISTPDLTRFLELFDKNPSPQVKSYIQGKLGWHNWPREPNAAAIILNLQMSSWGHKFMYDVETLGGVLTRAGFQNVQEFEENISNDPHLRDLEERDVGEFASLSDYESMSVEVEKPKAVTSTQ
jgi:predicted SAM-dependent methyltransferase